MKFVAEWNGDDDEGPWTVSRLDRRQAGGAAPLFGEVSKFLDRLPDLASVEQAGVKLIRAELIFDVDAAPHHHRPFVGH